MQNFKEKTVNLAWGRVKRTIRAVIPQIKHNEHKWMEGAVNFVKKYINTKILRRLKSINLHKTTSSNEWTAET